MSDQVTRNFLPAIMPELEINKASGSRDRVVEFFKDFQSEMKDLMKTLADDNVQEIEIDGIKVKKDSTALSYLLPEHFSRQEFTLSSLLDAYKFEQTMENKLNNISFA
jgi:hypothetical protein